MIRFVPICVVIASISLHAQTPAATTAAPTPGTGVATYQRRAVSPENLYHHIVTVVPFTGKGTYSDPKRPQYLPPNRASATDRDGILGFSYVVSDDGKSAIVEIVASNRTAFSAFYADKSLTIYEKGKHQKADIEAALQKVRKGFTLDTVQVAVR